MSGFKGNNKLSAKDTFRHRSLYSGYAFSEDGKVNVNPASTKNFWFLENLFYGRIREQSGEILVITPKLELMESFLGTNSGKSIKALDFVVDAFKNMTFEYEKARLAGSISEDSEYLSKLVPTNGLSYSTRQYSSTVNEVAARFLAYCKTVKKAADNIFSFDEFAPFFMEFFVKFLEYSSVTRSSYAISKRSSVMTSGLCLEVADLSHATDSDKSKFMNDKNFQTYRIFAANSGFAIDKNAPWRLVADMASEQMLKYASARSPGVSTAEDILDNYFIEIQDTYDELEEFKKMMAWVYNLFVRKNTAVYGHNTSSEAGTTLTMKNRVEEPFENIDSRIGNDFWYEKFLTVKNIELGLGYSDSEIRKMANNASDLEYSFDRSRATGYIKKRMTPIIPSEGSLTHKASKLKGKETAESSKKDAQSLARSLNKLIY